MASPTSLSGFLRDSEENLSLILSRAFTSLIPLPGKQTPEPVTMSVAWQSQGDAAMRAVGTKIPIDTPIPAAIDNILEKVTEVLVQHVGPNPVGRVRIRLYSSGKSHEPLVDTQRTIIPPDGLGIGDPNLALVRAELAEQRAINRTLQQQNTTIVGTLVTLVNKQAETIEHLGVTRAAASTGNDMASIAAVGGVVAMIVLRPQINEAMGLRKDATLAELGTRARALAATMMTPANEERDADPLAAPAPRRLPPEDAPPQIEQHDPPPAADPDDNAVVARMVARAASDPEFRKFLVDQTLSNPVLRDAAVTAAMQAMSSPKN